MYTIHAGPHVGTRTGTLIAGLLIAASATARVDDFTLADQHGVSHTLYDYSTSRAVVLMVQGNGCPIVRAALPRLGDIRGAYRDDRVEFLLLNTNLQDDAGAVRNEAREFDIDFPILLDTTQHVARALGVVRTAETFLIDTATWDIVYRGPIDDRIAYERQKPAAAEHYLIDAIDAHLAGRPVTDARRDGPGCLIYFPSEP